MILAAGPYQEHGEALTRVEAVWSWVRTHYANDPKSPWYAFGTVAMRTTQPGRLNHAIEEAA